MKWVPGEGTFSKKGGVKIPLNPDDFQLFHGIESEKILKDHTFFTSFLPSFIRSFSSTESNYLLITK